jgi:hypothetical protein
MGNGGRSRVPRLHRRIDAEGRHDIGVQVVDRVTGRRHLARRMVGVPVVAHR